MEPRSLKILIVDDNEDFLDVVGACFQASDWRIRTANSGQAALQSLAAESFDAMVTDLNMPLMTGFELIAHVRGDARFGALPIIVLTGYYSLECAQRLKALKVQRIVAKPLDFESLQQQILSCIGA
jgi:CheY-like chemotaxis protein